MNRVSNEIIFLLMVYERKKISMKSPFIELIFYKENFHLGFFNHCSEPECSKKEKASPIAIPNENLSQNNKKNGLGFVDASEIDYEK